MPEMFSLSLCTTDTGQRTPLLLLDVDLLERLGLVGCRCLYGRRLDNDGLVGSSDHLTPDKGELLLVEKNWYLLYLAIWSNDLLDNLNSPGWRLGGLVHLLGLQLYDLRCGLGLLGVHGDGLDAALDNLLLLLLWLRLNLLRGSGTSAGLTSSGHRVILREEETLGEASTGQSYSLPVVTAGVAEPAGSSRRPGLGQPGHSSPLAWLSA